MAAELAMMIEEVDIDGRFSKETITKTKEHISARLETVSSPKIQGKE